MTPRLALVLLVLGGASYVRAEPADEELSLEGFSGLINTPSAWTHADGSAHFLVTNQEDPRYRQYRRTRTYVVSAGFFRYLEVGARSTEVLRPDGSLYLEDLSLNAKLRLPIDLLFPRVPIAVAVGTQDEGGSGPHFRTRYAVASGELWRVRASLGYGLGPDRMKGVFGGVEGRVFEWARVLADYDGVEWNAGARLLIPVNVIGVPLTVGMLAKTSISHSPGLVEWGATVAAPLSFEPQNTPLRVGPLAARTGSVVEQVRTDLLEVGFENVRVWQESDALRVEVENNVFGRSEADAIGVVLGFAAARGDDSIRTCSLTLLRSKLATFEVSAPLADIRAFYAHVEGSEATLANAMTAEAFPRRRTPPPGVESGNSTTLHAQLRLSPSLRTFVGTELGALDFVVGVQPEGVVTLWKGATVYARWNLPLFWTPSFDTGHTLAAFRGGPRMDEAVLYQSFPIAEHLRAQIGAGVFRINSGGVLGEVLWTPLGGANAFGVQGGYMRELTGGEHPTLTASYRLNLAPIDTIARIRVGQFFLGDRGGTIEVLRNFGDTQFGFFATHTDHSVIGAMLSLPLTPREEPMKPGYLQIRGSPRWMHSLSTTIGERTNQLRSGIGTTLQTNWNLDAEELDAARLTRGSVLRDLPRARRAFELLRESRS